MSKPNVVEPFDENVKAYLRDELEKLGLHVETEYETFSHARTIDLVAECQEEDFAAVVGTAFDYFRVINVIELKGPNDRLRIKDFDRIMMRGWAANRLSIHQGEEDIPDDERQEQDEDEPANFIPPNERTITILCVVRPKKILDTLKAVYRFEQTDEPGIYLSDQIIPIRIIHPDELDLIPKNYPLLCVSRGQKLQAFIELCLQEGLDEYLQFILTVGMTTDVTVIWNRLMEVHKLKPVIKPETWGYIEEFFKEIPEAFESVPIIRNDRIRIEEQAREEGVIRGREEGIESGKVDNQRTMLIRLLRRKFTNSDEELLDPMIKKIEESEDTDMLDQWFDQIFDANALHELKL